MVERYGRVRLVRPGRKRVTTLVDIRDQVGIGDSRHTVDQRGLLSVAFPPDYARSGRLYLDYVDRGDHLRVSEWRQAGGCGRCSTSARRRRCTTAASSQFGPDRLLYISTGMGHGRDLEPGPGPPRRQDPAPRGRAARSTPSRSACATRGASPSTAARC